MRQKEEKLIVTFPTAAAAIAMERQAKVLGTPGRLIPTPTVVTADCGLAWMAPVEAQTVVRDMLKENTLQYSELLVLAL